MTVNNFFDTPTYYDVKEGIFTPNVINFTLPQECWKYVHYEIENTYTPKEQFGLAFDAVNNYVLSKTTYEEVIGLMKYCKTYKELQESLVSYATFILGLTRLNAREGFSDRMCFISLPEPKFMNKHFALNEYAFKAIVDYFEGDMLKVMCFTNNQTYLELPIK